MTPFEAGLLFICATAVGIALSYTGVSKTSYRFISLANVWVAVPGIFLGVYMTRGLLIEDVGITIMTVAFTLVSVGILLVWTRDLASELRGSVILNGTFVNSINLPFPILQILLGSYGYAVSFATANNMTQIIVAKVLQTQFRTGLGSGLRGSAARSAPFVALGLGVLLHYTLWQSIATPEVANQANDAVDLFIAVNFLYFGSSLGNSLLIPGSGQSLRSKHFLKVAAFRILIGPLIGVAMALPFLSNPGLFLQVVFEVSMPPAVTNTIFGSIYGFDVIFSAKSTTVLTPINTLEALGLFYAFQRFLF